MRKTVFILGAGASYACSSRTPLINQFFSRAKETGGICEEMRQEITATLEAKFGFTEAGLIAGQPNLEDVFSIVQMHRDMQDLFDAELKKEFEKFDSGFSQNRLEDLLYELITTVTWKELNGTGDLYDRLLVLTQPEDDLLTFNYDLQLDRALERTAKWSVSNGYGLDFEALLDKTGQWRKPEGVAESRPNLLKLHGSLNWLISTGYFKKNNGPLDYSDDHQGRHFVAQCLHRFPAASAFGLNVSFPDGNSNEILQLNIVPPTLRKEVLGSPTKQPISAIWRKAHAAVRAAERFVVIGYSLPPTDKHAEWLLRDALRESGIKSVELVIVNPRSQDRDRIAGIFEFKIGNRKDYPDFQEFLRG